MIQIDENIFYDESLSYQEQSVDVIELIEKTIITEPIEVVTEDCDSGNVRPLYKVFEFPTGAKCKVTYRYVNTAMSNEWAGIKRLKIEVYA